MRKTTGKIPSVNFVVTEHESNSEAAMQKYSSKIGVQQKLFVNKVNYDQKSRSLKKVKGFLTASGEHFL